MRVRWQKFLIDVNTDLCAYMAGKVKSVLMDQIVPLTNLFSNLNHTCPYTGQIIAKDVELGFKYLRFAIIPAGEYRVDLHFVSQKQLVADVKMQFTVDESVSRTDPSVG